MELEELYSNEYLIRTYFQKKCTKCKKKCGRCQENIVINRFYERTKGVIVPTVIYKCEDFEIEVE